MSVEALELFYEKIQEDDVLEAKAAEALGRTLGDVVALARLQGFEFSEDELMAALSKHAIGGSMELSDTDLDLVAGGTASQAIMPGSRKEMVRRS
ncbi:Nif11-like leader peptide family RiPP precursor [Pleomorphomonas sp. JP5]|uniref:Nif11-like leader peptide family RiPP precursor n=1 Tax=Pleomorphomonas sp. JP5 TaxID=2942998 RepID=UPI002044B00B|nr:Nif11-like leader peptide family RiPP precursor [Pleomorphomonas sp. JP5]MCM5558949.1 Nif11-like leader peptide family natural product precursor [Pleomorphomonas sp. JP5]